MRITLLIEEARVHDAAIILETLGFVADETAPAEVPKEGLLKVTGEFPEKNLEDLLEIDGIRVWFIRPSDETSRDVREGVAGEPDAGDRLMKPYYVISFPDEGCEATLEKLKQAGFELDPHYERWLSPASGARKASWIHGGRIADADLERVRAVEGAHVSHEEDVDPFLRRGGGITY